MQIHLELCCQPTGCHRRRMPHGRSLRRRIRRSQRMRRGQRKGRGHKLPVRGPCGAHAGVYDLEGP